MCGLIRQPYRHKVTLKQLMLELQLLARDDREGELTLKLEWQEPRWVGRTLRAEKLLEPEFVAETINDFEAEGMVYASTVWRPLEFCHGQPCEACPYQDDCTMLTFKEKRQGDDH